MTEKRFGRFVDWPKKHKITGSGTFRNHFGWQAGVDAARDLEYDSYEFAVLNSGDAELFDYDAPVMSRAGWD